MYREGNGSEVMKKEKNKDQRRKPSIYIFIYITTTVIRRQKRSPKKR